MEFAGNIVIPIGVFVALLSSVVSYFRQEKTATLIAKVAENQQEHHRCSQIVAVESTKQTTLLEQISHKINK